MFKNVELFYFSGTGNTLLLVEEMKEVFKENEIKVSVKKIEDTYSPKINKDSLVGLLFPINTNATMPFIWKFFKSLPEANANPIFMVNTHNGTPAISRPLFKLLKGKGYNPVASCEILMPNNIQFDSMKPDENNRVTLGKRKIREFTINLLEGSTVWDLNMKGSRLVSWLARNTPLPWITSRLFCKFKVDKEVCQQCKVCVNNCPITNIKMDYFPQHLNKCQFCGRCITNCTERAIYIKGKKDSVTIKGVV
ncbi:EFR1 family ferrodoxin [Orenia marismortui]|uniref:4Fe-4S ferredoxin-type domain-containing protein n=1 Tax=Orenia marismortui TaxID=46469 RepID=A0A4R8H7M4_9FIRM|nr:EFR1 family ferrodoxin [Orenia marismortui]TDX51517.1 hypothetical protein C7959_11217 [Orenia marismortui]